MTRLHKYRLHRWHEQGNDIRSDLFDNEREKIKRK